MDRGLTVAICTYNGAHRISMALDSMLKVGLSVSWEIIVVDNNSTDNLSEVLTAYMDIIPLRVVKELRQGLIFARWKAIDEAKFDTILFCDDDNILNQEYLQEGYDFLSSNSKIGVLAGQGFPLFETSKPDWFDAHQNFFAVGSLGRVQGKQEEGELVYGAGLFFRKEALKELHQKGFINHSTGRKGGNLSGGEDLELTLGLMLLGYEYWYNEKLTFKHFIESHRLTREYYLRLSKSIASSYPLMESFKLNRYENVAKLKLSLWQDQISLIKRIFLVLLKGIKYRNDRYKFRSKYLQWQFLAFFKNYRNTIHNFEYLKIQFFSESKS